MERNEKKGVPTMLGNPGSSDLAQVTKLIVLPTVLAASLLLMGVQAAHAQDWGYGYGGYGAGYGTYVSPAYGYPSGGYPYWYGDPYHYYTSPRNDHVGPHSAPHVGPHSHWLHGYHNGLHWQRHYDDHAAGGHRGLRPWRPH